MAADKKLLPPTNAISALSWAKEALRQGNYIPSRHLRNERQPERNVADTQIMNAIRLSKRCESYDRIVPDNGGIVVAKGRR